jgi:hypothetical protein
MFVAELYKLLLKFFAPDGKYCPAGNFCAIMDTGKEMNFSIRGRGARWTSHGLIGGGTWRQYHHIRIGVAVVIRQIDYFNFKLPINKLKSKWLKYSQDIQPSIVIPNGFFG